jgi:quercetin dioxygenase-like cupin family protein
MMDSIGRRLIVTGHSPEGRPVFISDDAVPDVELVGQAVRVRFLWGSDGIATFPDDGAMPAQKGALPSPGGWRFSTLTVAAGATGEYHQMISRAMGALAESEHPGFHRTPTLDLIIVLGGEFTLELDEGNERVLGKGDSAVLNGVRHRWHNRGATEATLVAVMIGAHDTRG